MTQEQTSLIKAIVLSIFDDDGPTPTIYWPNDMDEASRLLVAMKTISLLMGDSVYQNGTGIEGVNYFGILPFPDINLDGLTYFFLIADEKARGQAKAATITVLIDDKNKTFFYENMKYLRVIIDNTASKIQTAEGLDEYKEIIDEIRKELIEFCRDVEDPLSARKKIKIVYTGLDGAGKSSFLLGVKKKYSEIIKILPTRGIERTQEQLFSTDKNISIWDLGGQQKYRKKYLEQSKIYLYHVDLLFFMFDVQETGRIEEALDLFKRIIKSLDELEEFPPIIACLNKFDPDLAESPKILETVNYLTEEIRKNTSKFFVKIFKTSIFDYWSLVIAYSFGLSQLSPNQELFRKQLKKFGHETKSDAVLLLNENGIILSSYAIDDVSSKVFEISAPHFQILYKTFKEFKLLQKDFIVSSGVSDDSKKLIFKKIEIEKYHFYLLFFMEEVFNIENIETLVSDLAKNLKDLIQNYF